MATTTAKRVIVIDVKGSAEAIQHLKALEKHSKQVDKNIGKMQKAFNSLGNTVKAFIAYRLTAYIAQVVPAFIELSDSVSLMQSRLSLATGSIEETADVMDKLFGVAERSRGSIDAVATLYTRLATSTKDLGASQKELLDFTELVSNTFVLSGASAQEAESGVRQLSQAMAKGKLNGDEFVSIMENNVYFGDLMTKTYGKTRGELNAMAEAGELTASTLLKMGSEVQGTRDKIESMAVTSGQAATAIGNAFARIVSESSTLNELMGSLFGSIKSFADGVGQGSRQMYLFGDALKKSRLQAELLEARINALSGRKRGLGQLNTQLKELRSQDLFYQIEQQAKAVVKAQEGVNNVRGQSGRGARQNLANEKELLRVMLKVLEAESDFASNRKAAATSTGGGGGGTKEDPRAKAIKDFESALLSSQVALDIFFDKQERLDLLFQQGKINAELYNEQLKQLHGEANIENADKLISREQKILDFLNQRAAILNEESLMTQQIQKLYDKNIITLESRDAALEEFGQTVEEVEKKTIDWGNISEQAVNGISGAFIDMAINGKNSFEDFAQSFLVNIAKMIAQQAILNALSGTSFGAAIGLADGGVINRGNITPFASGGVVNSPTVFPMANGVGLMGEAGPEAIMPLSRGSDGKLGVSSSGGSTSVNQNIVISGTGDERLAEAMRQAAYDGYQMAVIDAQRNGPMRRTMGV